MAAAVLAGVEQRQTQGIAAAPEIKGGEQMNQLEKLCEDLKVLAPEMIEVLRATARCMEGGVRVEDAVRITGAQG